MRKILLILLVTCATHCCRGQTVVYTSDTSNRGVTFFKVDFQSRVYGDSLFFLWHDTARAQTRIAFTNIILTPDNNTVLDSNLFLLAGPYTGTPMVTNQTVTAAWQVIQAGPTYGQSFQMIFQNMTNYAYRSELSQSNMTFQVIGLAGPGPGLVTGQRIKHGVGMHVTLLGYKF